jgi:hypothetical protein
VLLTAGFVLLGAELPAKAASKSSVLGAAAAGPGAGFGGGTPRPFRKSSAPPAADQIVLNGVQSD